MKTQIVIVTGFLGSGKTTFINSMLENEKPSSKSTVIIQGEFGEAALEDSLLEDKNICVQKLDKETNLDAQWLQGILKKYLPDRVIVELNGMHQLEDALTVMDDRSIRKSCAVDKIVCTIDASTFDLYMNNMGAILIEQISNSDFIVVNKADNFSKPRLDAMEKTLKAINKFAEIVRGVMSEEENISADHGAMYMEKEVRPRKPSDKLFAAFIILVAGYLFFSVFRSVDFSASSIDLSWLQVLNTVFLSILIQAFPFILFGVFVSAIIQVFVSSETIVKLFPRKKGLGFVAAALVGLFFPVCDCAIIPVAARLVKKGVPIPTAVTFMLAAPIVNPIVIASTLYAFPGQPSIAFYRVYLGITVALAVGLIFLFFPEANTSVLNGFDNFTCKCGYCGDRGRPQNIWSKIEAIFKHAGAEFFEVGRYLIVGAFLSSIFQTMVPKDILASLGGDYIAALLIMMLSAFVLSVCSTSDAFIARTFVSQFPMGAVMGFMILGPMLDIKNLLMLMGSFRKRFVAKLVLVVFGLSFALLLFLTTLLFG